MIKHLRSNLTRVLLSSFLLTQLTSCGALTDILLTSLSTSGDTINTSGGSGVSGGDAEEQCEEHYCLLLTKGSGSAEYSIRSKSKVSYSYEFSFSGENVDFSPSATKLFALKPGETLDLVKISAIDRTQGFQWKLQSKAQIGSFEATPDKAHVYTLPYESGEKFRVDQGYFGTFSHNTTAMNNYALDFNLPTGTNIVASRAGTVIDVVDNFTESGPDPALAEKANRVMVEHDDGSIANYVHINTNGSKVSVGQQVEVGDILALSGDVGFSSGPHLHFAVMSLSKELEFVSFATDFKTEVGEQQLTEGETYTAP